MNFMSCKNFLAKDTVYSSLDLDAALARRVETARRFPSAAQLNDSI